MTKRTRRTSGAAAASLVSVAFLPLATYAATGDVDVSITNHSRQDVVNGPNVSVETSFTSLTTRNVARVEFVVDGKVVAAQRLGEPVRKGNYIFAWDTTSLSNDVHTIEARAYDDQGNIGESRLQLFVDNQAIDRSLPRVRVTVPQEGAVVSGQFWIQVNTAQDSLEPVSLLSVKLDDDLIGALGIQPGEHSVRMLFNGGDLPDGPHLIQAGTITGGGSKVLSPPVIIIVKKASGNTSMNPGAPPTAVPSGDSGVSPSGPGVDGGPPAISPIPVPDGVLSPKELNEADGVAIPHSLVSPPVISTPDTGALAHRQQRSQRQSVPVSSHPKLGHLQSPRPSTPPVEIALAPGDGARPQEQRFQGWFMPGQLKGPGSLAPSSDTPTPSSLRSPGAMRINQNPQPNLGHLAQPTEFILVEANAPIQPGANSHSGAVPHPLSPVPHTSLIQPGKANHSTTPNLQRQGISTLPVSPAPATTPGTPPASVALLPHLNGHPSGAAEISPNTTFFVPYPVVIEPKTPTSLPTRIALRPHTDPTEAIRVQRMAHQAKTPQWLRVAYDNHWMNFDVPPMMVGGVAEMPFRALFERGGGTVDWHADTRTVTAEKPGRTVEVQIGSRNASINHQVVQLIMPAFIKRGRTMIPLGFIREAMDVNVHYNQTTGEVILTSKRVMAMVVR